MAFQVQIRTGPEDPPRRFFDLPLHGNAMIKQGTGGQPTGRIQQQTVAVQQDLAMEHLAILTSNVKASVGIHGISACVADTGYFNCSAVRTALRAAHGKRTTAVKTNSSSLIAECVGARIVHFRRDKLVIPVQAGVGIGSTIAAPATGKHAIMKTDAQQGILLNVVVGIVGAFIGGWLIGPLVGAIVINLLPETFRVLKDYQDLVYGVALILLLIYAPGGLAALTRPFKRKQTAPIPVVTLASEGAKP